MTIFQVLILAMGILYLFLICLVLIMLRRLTITLVGIVWNTYKLLKLLSKNVVDGDHTNGQKSFDELLDAISLVRK